LRPSFFSAKAQRIAKAQRKMHEDIDWTPEEMIDLAARAFEDADDVGVIPANAERLIRVFEPSEWKTSGACFWDWLGDDLPAWANLKYVWIASSVYGDQVILTHNSPIHEGAAVYMHGPDISGPKSCDPNWTDNILYLGSSVDEWLSRIRKFGDEYAVENGSIDERLENAGEYREVMQRLNPGLPW
jgi:hypothetical protein